VALAAVHSLKTEANRALDACTLREDDRRDILETVESFNSVLNVFGRDEAELLDADIQALIDERQQARHRRDFRRADEIRDQLAARGITLEDTRDGVRWKRRGT
jgi:cysteinyl-tRNA synthetase